MEEPRHAFSTGQQRHQAVLVIAEHRHPMRGANDEHIFGGPIGHLRELRGHQFLRRVRELFTGSFDPVYEQDGDLLRHQAPRFSTYDEPIMASLARPGCPRAGSGGVAAWRAALWDVQ